MVAYPNACSQAASFWHNLPPEAKMATLQAGKPAAKSLTSVDVDEWGNRKTLAPPNPSPFHNIPDRPAPAPAAPAQAPAPAPAPIL
jgi:hypothetical protein